MSRRGREPAATAPVRRVQYFVDENVAGLGLRLRDLRPPHAEVIVASHPPIGDQVPRDDPDWIPYVAHRGWVVITNDKHLRTRPAEAPKAIEFGLRCAHLAPLGKDPPVWDFMRLLLLHWEAVAGLADRDGPVWLQVDGKRSSPYERDYRPGQPPRVPRDDRADRARSARRSPRRSAPKSKPTTDPGQDPLPF